MFLPPHQFWLLFLHQRHQQPQLCNHRIQGYRLPRGNSLIVLRNNRSPLRHLSSLQLLFTWRCYSPCKECGGDIIVEEVRRTGLAVGLRSMCKRCANVCGTTFTSRKSSSQAFEVNKTLVAATTNIGVGYSQMNRMCEVLGMPYLHLKTHQNYVSLVHQAATSTMSKICTDAVKIVRDVYGAGEGDVADISVTFDGTWHKRGHTSNHGAAVVICAVTGLVIDSHVMLLHCQLCKTTRQRLDGNQNFHGSSGGMEVAAAKVMWGRSLDQKLRYTTLISDGDSKTYNALKDLQPYEVQIQKAECVNHVAKRLGTALKNLVNDQKKKGVTLGGRGAGTLTQEKMGKLQSYDTKAVRTHNKSVEDMNDGIWASFYHSTSTDELPRHDHCPVGEDSWCFYNRAIGRGQPTPSHTNGSTFLNAKVAPYVEKVYVRLTQPDLLEKCLSGMTQNANESLHSQIWNKCPKHIFVNRPRIEIATALAISEWNQGSLATHHFMEELGTKVNQISQSMGIKRDKYRVRQAELAMEETAKKRREVRKTAVQRERRRLLEVERLNNGGGAAYAAGSGGF